MKALQKSLLLCAKQVDKEIRKVKTPQMLYLFSKMSHNLHQYAEGSEMGFADVSIYGLKNWLKYERINRIKNKR